jgi:hypothetical protein
MRRSMIDLFPRSGGGGQCPLLRGIDRLPSAAKTVSPAMTNKPDRATILIRMLYHGSPSPTSGTVYRLDGSRVSVSTRGTRFTENRPRASPSAAEFALRNRTLTKILYETLTEPGGRCLTLKEMDYENQQAN